VAVTPRRRSSAVGSTLYGAESAEGGALERIIRTAYDLFSVHGVQAIGVDRISEEARVAKMTLYRYFRSKDDLVIAVLKRREERWTTTWLEREVERRGGPARARLLAVFDVLEIWFESNDYEGCLFVNTLLEVRDPATSIGTACVAHLANVRAFIRDLAVEAGVHQPNSFAQQWQTLMWGSFIAAAYGDRDAAHKAREVASLLLERSHPANGSAKDKRAP
jgi:AcrR family transcriptional regulator